MKFNEQLILHRIREGSYNDFCVIYDRYAPLLYNFVYDLSRSKYQSEEIVQETFLKVWVGREQIDPSRSFKSLLYTIAKNRFIDVFRKQLRDPMFEDYMVWQNNPQMSDASGDELLDFDAFNRRLAEAKATLSPRQRQIFEMSKEQGMSAEEIAAELGITEQVVYNQVSQALRKLKELMGNYSSLFVVLFM